MRLRLVHLFYLHLHAYSNCLGPYLSCPRDDNLINVYVDFTCDMHAFISSRRQFDKLVRRFYFTRSRSIIRKLKKQYVNVL